MKILKHKNGSVTIKFAAHEVGEVGDAFMYAGKFWEDENIRQPDEASEKIMKRYRAIWDYMSHRPDNLRKFEHYAILRDLGVIE